MTLSLVIPTWNRADILDDCLSRLPDIDCEVIVSDNASTDHTDDVIFRYEAKDERIKGVALPTNQGAFANLRHAVSHAQGDVICYLADDDSLLGEPLKTHVDLMHSEPIVALYCDPIAWDDAQQVEMHRYFGLSNPVTFENDHTQLLNFMLSTMIPPEIGLFRRDAMIRAQIPTGRALPFHIWLYGYARQGMVRFDPLAFYREHLVMKPALKRATTINRAWAMSYMGDEQRLGLEGMACLIERDLNLSFDKQPLSQAIDRMLHQRASLEINRACQRGDYIMAVELRRRQMLWGLVDVQSDDAGLTAKAAEQASRIYAGLTDAPTLDMLIDAYRLDVGVQTITIRERARG